MDDYSVSYSADMSSNPVFWIVYAAVIVVGIIAMWRVFTKAGRPGWAAIVPIYNTYTLIKIAGYSGWFLLLLLIPVVNIVILVVISLGVAKNFGKSGVFGFIGLVIFSLIGYLILAFGSAQYVGDKGVTA
jgi:hypothetical protein